MERIIIKEVLLKTNNNKAEAARLLDIDYKTLYNKLKKINQDEEL
jgi:two-component system nitrogen regulation response regulator GlnG